MLLYPEGALRDVTVMQWTNDGSSLAVGIQLPRKLTIFPLAEGRGSATQHHSSSSAAAAAGIELVDTRMTGTEAAHRCPVRCLDQDRTQPALFLTGDGGGTLRLWDVRCAPGAGRCALSVEHAHYCRANFSRLVGQDTYSSGNSCPVTAVFFDDCGGATGGCGGGSNGALSAGADGAVKRWDLRFGGGGGRGGGSGGSGSSNSSSNRSSSSAKSKHTHPVSLLTASGEHRVRRGEPLHEHKFGGWPVLGTADGREVCITAMARHPTDHRRYLVGYANGDLLLARDVGTGRWGADPDEPPVVPLFEPQRTWTGPASRHRVGAHAAAFSPCRWSAPSNQPNQRGVWVT
jgi:WD40 repeat protein